MARVFFLKSTPHNMWVMWVYIVWVKTWCIRYDKIAKQNVSRVSRKNALPTKYSRKPTVNICHDSSHSSHVLGTWLHFAGRLLMSYPWKLLWSSILSWVFTHNPYNEIPHKIQGTYDWTKLQSNLVRNYSQYKIVVNHNFTRSFKAILYKQFLSRS